MTGKETEENLLRSAALQNSQTILRARQRADQELVQAKEALERKTAELAHSLSLLRATLESTTNGILVTDERGQVTGFNEKFLELWRLPRAALEGAQHVQLRDCFSEQVSDPLAYLAQVGEIYRSWPAESFDLIEFKDGRAFERFSKIQRIEDRSVGRVWSFRDVTDRRRAERELEEQSAWFRVTLASIGDAVVTVDTACRVTYLNPVAEKLTGWARPEAAGRPVGEIMRIVHEGTRDPAVNPIDRALAEGVVVGLANHTTLLGRGGAEIPIEDSAAPIKNPGGEIIGAVMVFHDVSERRQKEVAVARLYQAEQQARGAAEQANQAKDHFLATLSHELRTPLTPVLAILSTFGEGAALPAELAGDLEVMRRNIVLEARLIDDLLDLTRITRGRLDLQYAPAPVDQLLENAIGICAGELKAKRLTLIRDLAQPAPVLLADGPRVTQILWNLLKNAIKFTPEEGRITLRSRVAAAGGSRQLVIVVEDTGMGIAPGQLGRVFDAFEQGSRGDSRRFGGLGRGLTISKGIAEAHGGTITAASPGEDRGSAFTLTLPLEGAGEAGLREAAPADPAPAAAPAREARAPGRPQRILLVEDHADTAAILGRLLRRSGYEVLPAGTVGSALEVARREMAGAGLDLVVSDLGLPDGSGLDLMRQLAAAYRLRGIALSGFGMEADLAQSMAAGFSRHLIKPGNIGILRAAIAELMPEPGPSAP
jgi:PAS domain S-box-containing protein